MPRLFKLSGGIVARNDENMELIARRLSARLNLQARESNEIERLKVVQTNEHEMDFELVIHASSWGEAQAIGTKTVADALRAIQVTLVEDDSHDMSDNVPNGSYVESLGTMLSYA